MDDLETVADRIFNALAAAVAMMIVVAIVVMLMLAAADTRSIRNPHAQWEDSSELLAQPYRGD